MKTNKKTGKVTLSKREEQQIRIIIDNTIAKLNTEQKKVIADTLIQIQRSGSCPNGTKIVAVDGFKKIAIPINLMLYAIYLHEQENEKKWLDVETWKPLVIRAELACAFMQNNSTEMFMSVLKRLTGMTDDNINEYLEEFRANYPFSLSIKMDRAGMPLSWSWVPVKKTEDKNGVA